MIRLSRFPEQSGTHQVSDNVDKRRMFRLVRFGYDVRAGCGPEPDAAGQLRSSFLFSPKRNKRNKRNNRGKSRSWADPDMARLCRFGRLWPDSFTRRGT